MPRSQDIGDLAPLRGRWQRRTTDVEREAEALPAVEQLIEAQEPARKLAIGQRRVGHTSAKEWPIGLVVERLCHVPMAFDGSCDGCQSRSRLF